MVRSKTVHDRFLAYPVSTSTPAAQQPIYASRRYARAFRMSIVIESYLVRRSTYTRLSPIGTRTEPTTTTIDPTVRHHRYDLRTAALLNRIPKRRTISAPNLNRARGSRTRMLPASTTSRRAITRRH